MVIVLYQKKQPGALITRCYNAVMNILVILNGLTIPKQLIAFLPPATVATYPLSKELDSINPNNFDFVILGGSSRLPIAYSSDVVKPEIDLIKRCKVPLLGIFYGCELVAVTYGATLRDVGEKEKIKGVNTIYATDNALFTPASPMSVYESHRWVVDNLPAELVIEAESKFGPEIIRHYSLPHVGFQFHPEKFVASSDGDELFRAWYEKYVEFYNK